MVREQRVECVRLALFGLPPFVATQAKINIAQSLNRVERCRGRKIAEEYEVKVALERLWDSCLPVLLSSFSRALLSSGEVSTVTHSKMRIVQFYKIQN
jgi:hypothetical protein